MSAEERDEKRAREEKPEDLEVPEGEGENVKGGLVATGGKRLANPGAARGFDPQPDPPGGSVGGTQGP
jgi:hypothetical protein